MVSRVYVEKKPGFDVEAQQLLAELHTAVPEGLAKAARLRLINCYDVEGIDEELFERCIPTVFSEPQVDDASRKFPVAGVEFSGKSYDVDTSTPKGQQALDDLLRDMGRDKRRAA